MAKSASLVAVDCGLKLSASLCFLSSLFCFLVVSANQGDDKAKLKTLISASTAFFSFAASFFVCFLLKCFEYDVAEEDLSYVVHLRASDKSKLRSTEIELLLANLQLLLCDINEILNYVDEMKDNKQGDVHQINARVQNLSGLLAEIKKDSRDKRRVGILLSRGDGHATLVKLLAGLEELVQAGTQTQIADADAQEISNKSTKVK